MKARMEDLFDSKSVSPMLIGEERPAFNSDGWLYELKLDGIRCIAYLDTDGVVLRNKRNKDITSIFPELANVYRQAARRCILDGELFVMKDGRPSFSEVQRRALLTNKFRVRLMSEKLPASFVVFDLLYHNDVQITDRTLMERKALLEKIIVDSERMALSKTFSDGVALYEAAQSQSLEGIVAKRADSRYYFGKRTKDWIKCKAMLDEDFIICGYYEKSAGLISVIIGSYDGDKIVYRGHVVMGVSRSDYARMKQIPSTLKEKHYHAFYDFDGAVWLEPELVGTVRFMEYTSGGGLRQPVFKGLRDDKSPKECVLERI